MTVTPSTAEQIRNGQRVRFTYHEPTSVVRSSVVTTCDGKPSVFFKVEEEISGEIFDVYVAPDQTVWVVETVGEGKGADLAP